MKNIETFDTTLRDGTQGEGINLSPYDKLKIANKLDDLGINIIEGGWPGSNPKDMVFFKLLKKNKLNQAQVCSFGSTARRPDEIETDKNLISLIDSETPIVTIFGKAWSFHSKSALGLTSIENANLIERSISFLVKNNRRVIFDAEHFFDGYKSSPEFSIDMVKAAHGGGADTVVLCDTNGGTLPNEIIIAVSDVRDKCSVKLGIHSHNDGGLAVANTLAAVNAGVTHVQGTINGVGERGGNASLATIIPNLILKMGRKTQTKINLKKLSNTVNFVYDVMNVRPDNQAPFVGRSAFAHKGGVHVSAILKNSKMYEHIDPKLVGNERRVLLSELSGKSNLKYKADKFKLDINDDKKLINKIILQIKELELEGYQFEGAEASLELIILKEKKLLKSFFKILDYRVSTNFQNKENSKSEASVKVQVLNKIEHVISGGVGPVNALNNAIKKALKKFYFSIKNVKLVDYKVRVIDGQNGTESKVRVLSESTDGSKNWVTVGVSRNIIDATLKSLKDSYDFYLIKNIKE